MMEKQPVREIVQQVSSESIVDYNQCPGGVPALARKAANEAVYMELLYLGTLFFSSSGVEDDDGRGTINK